MKNSIIFGLIALQALLVVGIFSSVATPALAVEKSAEKSADDKINKMYEICNKIIGYYDDYNFGNEKTYKVYKLCEILSSKSKWYYLIVNEEKATIGTTLHPNNIISNSQVSVYSANKDFFWVLFMSCESFKEY